MIEFSRAEALEDSIVKWKRNGEANTPDDYLTGPNECALCVLYWAKNCTGCPVNEAGHYRCRGTPYELAESCHDNWTDDPYCLELRDIAHDAAWTEVKFLESLRE